MAAGILWASLACGPGPEKAPAPGSAESGNAVITVSAAASLTDAFQEVAGAFEELRPGVEVRLNLAGSAALSAQILEGAPVDVFAAAAPGHLAVVAEELVEPGRIFATNRLRIVVPHGNPGDVGGLADLSRDELVVGLCAPAVPCGELAREALDRAGVAAAPDTEEPNARALLTKVRLGEVDAAVVYASDVLAGGGEVDGLDIPEAWSPVAHYPIAVLRGSSHPMASRDFVSFVLSERGAAILARHGFGPPPEVGP